MNSLSRGLRAKLDSVLLSRVIITSFVVFSACATTGGHQTDDTSDSQTLSLMSFNVRWPSPKDGDNLWDKRKQMVARIVAEQAPDVLGLQEAFESQGIFLLGQLPQYKMIGVGRNNGDREGEMTAILYRDDRFSLIDSGHIWLSTTPEVPGSVGWDAMLTRMATWLFLECKLTNRRFVVLNAHFDHRGVEARHQSAKLIYDFVSKKSLEYGRVPVIVMGDFNEGEGSPPYRALTEPTSPLRLADSFRAFVASRGAWEGTFNGFSGKTLGERIDWILVSSGFEVIHAGVQRVHEDGRYPSDHFPVTTIVRF